MDKKIVLTVMSVILLTAFAFNAEIIPFGAVIAVGSISVIITLLLRNEKVQSKHSNNVNSSKCISKSA